MRVKTPSGSTISLYSRGSGTTRTLLYKAVANAINGNNSYIIVPSGVNTIPIRDITNRLIDDTHDTHVARGVRNRVKIFHYDRIRDINETLTIMSLSGKIFFDEYELMRDIPYIPTSYYVSTPMTVYSESETCSLVRQIRAKYGHSVDRAMSILRRVFLELRNGNAETNNETIFDVDLSNIGEVCMCVDETLEEEISYLNRLGITWL